MIFHDALLAIDSLADLVTYLTVLFSFVERQQTISSEDWIY